MADKKNIECLRCESLTKAEHEALKALNNGEANAYQQKLSLSIIINKFSRAHDLLYVPGSFDQSALLNGRAFVGQKILKHLNIPVGQLNNEVEEDEKA